MRVDVAERPDDESPRGGGGRRSVRASTRISIVHSTVCAAVCGFVAARRWPGVHCPSPLWHRGTLRLRLDCRPPKLCEGYTVNDNSAGTIGRRGPRASERRSLLTLFPGESLDSHSAFAATDFEPAQ